MRFRRLCVLLLLAGVAPSLFADATIQYTTSVKLGPVIAAAATLSKKPLNITPPAPTSRTMRLKNGKIEQDGGAFTGIFDSKNSQVTLVDPTRKLFATTSLEELIGQVIASMPPAPPNASPQVKMFLQSMAMTYASEKTGRTGMTLGLATEETEMTASLNVTLPSAMRALLPNASAQPGAPVTLLKFVVQMWYPAQAEVARVPALGEVASFWSDQNSASGSLTGLIAGMQKLLVKYPGLASGLAAMTADMFKDRGAMLKMDIDVYAPVLAQLAPMMKAHGMPSFDLSAPVLELSTEAVEVSSALIDDSVFGAPSGYRATPIADFLRAERTPAGARAGRLGGEVEPATPPSPADGQGLGRLPF